MKVAVMNTELNSSDIFYPLHGHNLSGEAMPWLIDGEFMHVFTHLSGMH